MTSFFRKLRWSASARRRERDLREELDFHLSEDADARAREDGVTTGQAYAAARADLGSPMRVREETRQLWTWMFVEQLAQDIRYALRTLRRSPGFAAVAVLSLALGIGANTAIYSFMDAILVRALPVADPQSLVALTWQARDARDPASGQSKPFVMRSQDGSAYPEPDGSLAGGIFPSGAFELVRQNPVFAAVFGQYGDAAFNVVVEGKADTARGLYVTGDYFHGLGVRSAAGRVLDAGDDRDGAAPVVVVGAGFAQRYFGDISRAPGQTIAINNSPFTIAGVAPAGFLGIDPAAMTDLYLPMSATMIDVSEASHITRETYADQNFYWLEIVARLRPGITAAQAQAAVAPVFAQWVSGTATPEERANLPTLRLAAAASGLDTLRRQYAKPIVVLLALVGLILAIACANIANLLLARAAARRREMAVRLGIGAGRSRIVHQLLTESLVLAVIGGALGTLLAVWGVRFLALLLANGQQNFMLQAAVNWRVLGVTMALSAICGTLFGLAPAIQATRADVLPALKDARGSASQPRLRLGFLGASLTQVLVVAQIAISLLLLVAAGLFVRTLSNLESLDLGFNRDQLLLFDVNAAKAGHRDPEIASFYDGLQRDLAQIPGVRAATLSHASLIGAGRSFPVVVSGKAALGTRILMAGPAFFDTMQIALRQGREITGRDQAGAPRVAVVSEMFAARFLGSGNVVGRYLEIDDEPVQVVGVAANAQYGRLRGDARPVVYLAYAQGSLARIQQMTYALRTAGDPLAPVARVREILHRADARIPLTRVRTQAAEINQTINQELIFARLCTGFALLALVIAAVGLYGTIGYGVVRRTGEIGIRMALGAGRPAILWLVLREVVLLVGAGVAISIPAALAATRFIESFLFRTPPNDPVAFAAAMTTLVVATLVAGYLPARRASRTDPLRALRHE